MIAPARYSLLIIVFFLAINGCTSPKQSQRRHEWITLHYENLNTTRKLRMVSDDSLGMMFEESSHDSWNVATSSDGIVVSEKLHVGSRQLEKDRRQGVWISRYRLSEDANGLVEWIDETVSFKHIDGGSRNLQFTIRYPVKFTRGSFAGMRAGQDADFLIMHTTDTLEANQQFMERNWRTGNLSPVQCLGFKETDSVAVWRKRELSVRTAKTEFSLKWYE